MKKVTANFLRRATMAEQEQEPQDYPVPSTLSSVGEQLLLCHRDDPFPKKLFRILEDAEQNGEEDIIGFMPHGKTFVVRDISRFVVEMMPRYFSTVRYSSFLRQLNLYGFQRVPEQDGSYSYHNELFNQKNKSVAWRRLQRKKQVRRSKKKDRATKPNRVPSIEEIMDSKQKRESLSNARKATENCLLRRASDNAGNDHIMGPIHHQNESPNNKIQLAWARRLLREELHHALATTNTSIDTLTSLAGIPARKAAMDGRHHPLMHQQQHLHGAGLHPSLRCATPEQQRSSFATTNADVLRNLQIAALIDREREEARIALMEARQTIDTLLDAGFTC